MRATITRSTVPCGGPGTINRHCGVLANRFQEAIPPFSLAGLRLQLSSTCERAGSTTHDLAMRIQLVAQTASAAGSELVRNSPGPGRKQPALRTRHRSRHSKSTSCFRVDSRRLR